MARGKCGTQFAADAGLCWVWETLKGRETSCRRGCEPCQSGVGIRFGRKSPGGEKCRAGEIPRRRKIGCNSARAHSQYRAAASSHINNLRRVLAILAEMGFQVYTSREVETDEMNFQMLNFPPHHPAREMQDSFYVEAEGREDNPILMRTHTSPGQIRAMREAAATEPAESAAHPHCIAWDVLSLRADHSAF